MPPPSDKPLGKTILDFDADDSDEDDDDYAPPDAASTSAAAKRKLAADAAAAEEEAVKRQKLENEDEETKKARIEAERLKAEATLKSFMEVEEESKLEREKGMVVKADDEEMVEISRPRNFAGDVIYETVRLPKSHPDVAKYSKPVTTATTISEPSTSSTRLLSTSSCHLSTDPSSSTAASATASTSQPPPPPSRPKSGAPIRRRPKQSLEAMSAALDGGPKKMSTFEKSKMDWQSHTSRSTTLADELAANRKPGGGSYLEKTDFLQRVGERRQDGPDSNPSGSRRK